MTFSDYIVSWIFEVASATAQETRGALSRTQVSLPGSVDHKAGSALYG